MVSVLASVLTFIRWFPSVRLRAGIAPARYDTYATYREVSSPSGGIRTKQFRGRPEVEVEVEVEAEVEVEVEVPLRQDSCRLPTFDPGGETSDDQKCRSYMHERSSSGSW
jgi:hypothetical protein